MIPKAKEPEYRLTLVWRSDADGNGTRAYLEHWLPDGSIAELQASFHPILDLCETVERAMDHFFEDKQ